MAAAAAGRRFRVIVVDSRPELEGRFMLQRLLQVGFQSDRGEWGSAVLCGDSQSLWKPGRRERSIAWLLPLSSLKWSLNAVASGQSCRRAAGTEDSGCLRPAGTTLSKVHWSVSAYTFSYKPSDCQRNVVAI